MFKLMFEKNSQFFIVTIDNKVIKYWDRFQGDLWGGPLQYLPPDPSVIKKIDMSRNRIPQQVKEMLIIPKDEMLEFKNAKDDEELKELVIRDCKRQGCKMIDVKDEKGAKVRIKVE